MSAPLPSYVKVLSVYLQVKPMTKEEGLEQNRFGFFAPATQVIGLDTSLSPSKLADTFIHELFHAVFWICDFHGVARNVKAPEELEEILVGQMSSIWMAVMMDNPDLMRYLAEAAKYKPDGSPAAHGQEFLKAYLDLEKERTL